MPNCMKDFACERGTLANTSGSFSVDVSMKKGFHFVGKRSMSVLIDADAWVFTREVR